VQSLKHSTSTLNCNLKNKILQLSDDAPPAEPVLGKA